MLKIKAKAHKEKLQKIFGKFKFIVERLDNKNERFEEAKEKSQSFADYMQVDNKKK